MSRSRSTTRSAALLACVLPLGAGAGAEPRAFSLAEALAARGFAVTKKQVELDEPIKTGGFYKIPIRVGPGVTAQVDLNVVVGK